MPSFKVVGFTGGIFDKSDRGKSREKRQHQSDIYDWRDVEDAVKASPHESASLVVLAGFGLYTPFW